MERRRREDVGRKGEEGNRVEIVRGKRELEGKERREEEKIEGGRKEGEWRRELGAGRSQKEMERGLGEKRERKKRGRRKERRGRREERSLVESEDTFIRRRKREERGSWKGA